MTKSKHVGALSEVAACAWLLSQGYEVFRNVSPHGPADILVWEVQTDEVTKIDVTTGRKYVRQDGVIVCSSPPKSEGKQGVRVLVHFPETGETLWLADVPESPPFDRVKAERERTE